MDQHDNLPEQLHRTSEDKRSKPRLRGQLLHPDELHAGSLQTNSSPSRFGSMRLGIEESVVGLLIYFPLLALLRWFFGRRGRSVPVSLGDKANKSPGDFVVAKCAAYTTIRHDLPTATGSRAKHSEEDMSLGPSSDPGVGHDIEAGASAPSSPRPRPPLPPLTIDEVLQKSVWGFREKWWPMSSTAAFEAARIEEAEGNVGGIGGFDMIPETKAFLDKFIYSHPLCISISISRTCPAVEEDTCYLPSPSATEAGYPLPSSTSTSPLSVSSACPAVKEHTCLVPSPSVANAARSSFSSAAEEVTGRTRADTTETDVAGSILAGSEFPPAVVSSRPVVVKPTLFENLSLGEVAPERLLSRVESRLPLSQGFAGMEAINLDLPDGVTGGQLETSESGYDGDNDDDDDDSRPGSLSIKGVFLDSSEQQEEEEMEEMGEDEQEEEDMEVISRADRAIGVNLRTIGSDEDNDDDDVRYVGSNRFAVLFESSDEEEEEQEDDMESVSLADRETAEKIITIGSDDGNDDNDSNDARYVSNNRFAVLFESSVEEEEEEEGKRQEEEEEWGDKWGEECDEEDEEEEESEEPKEEKEARQMEMGDDEAQDMQEEWREIDEEWEAMEEWVEDEEEEEEEGEQESVDN